MKVRILAALMAGLLIGYGSIPTHAQTADVSAETTAPDTGSTLEQILARQRGEGSERIMREDDAAARAGDIAGQLGTLGGSSDAAVWESLRFGTADIRVSNTSPAANVLVQDHGIWWLNFREGPLRIYGGYLLLGMIGLLAVFYLLRGKIRIEGGKSGITIERFKPIERFGHWLLAGSFILLGITGLVTLFGRIGLIPYLGKESYAMLAMGSKWVHNNISWAFMLGLALVFLFWVLHNLPNRTDIVWLAKGGGLFSKHSHPPAKKFNAGQKLIFWSVILFGVSISATGLSLLFPFELPMFAKTFAMLNATGLPEVFGYGVLPTELAPHQEMQFAQLWHSIMGFVLMAIILAHIYIGTLGMEGAYDAMGSGQVDLQWAKEHHSLWVEEVQSAAGAETASDADKAAATPAE